VSGRRIGTKKDHLKFVETEGWELKRTARGKIGDHHRYRLYLPNGDVLTTKISHPPNKECYGIDLWTSILDDQLRVSEEAFWACVEHGRLPQRGPETIALDERALPSALVFQLAKAGVPAEEIAGMDRDRAVQRLSQLYSQPRD